MYIIAGKKKLKEIKTVLSKAIQKNPDITAIFTMSDAMAIGACRQLKDMGKNVPDDISIIGFDGISLGQYFCPRLTTIKQLEEQLADDGLAVLLEGLENHSSATHKLVPFEFVEGESVKKID